MIYCRVKELLNKKGEDITWLANNLKCSIEFAQELVDNQNDSIDFEMIEKLCDIFECTPNDIFDISIN